MGRLSLDPFEWQDPDFTSITLSFCSHISKNNLALVLEANAA